MKQVILNQNIYKNLMYITNGKNKIYGAELLRYSEFFDEKIKDLILGNCYIEFLRGRQ